MGEIELRKYSDIKSYRDGVYKSVSHIITQKDLIRFAISAGGFSNWSPGKKGQAFYRSIVKMAVEDTGSFIIQDDYKYSEQSIKAAISFFMGMIAAKAIAEKEYGIKYLFHLKDPQIIYCSTGKTPDFFGLSVKKKTTPYLFESKGTASKKPSIKTINKSKEQLSAIQTIEIEGWPVTYNDTQFKLHTIASGFDKDILTFYDVDPKSNGNAKLVINLDKAIVQYYSNIMKCLLTQKRREYSLNQTTFLVTHVDEYEIGINKDIYELLLKYKDIYMADVLHPTLDNINFSECYSQITRINQDTDEYYQQGLELSIGLDGTICIPRG